MTQTDLAVDTSTDGSEKRRWPRYLVDVPMCAVVSNKDILKKVYGRAMNLSKGGVAAVLPVEIIIGQAIQVEILLPYSSQLLRVNAVVRNRRSYSYGLEFSNITASQQAAIERTCASLEVLQ